MLSRETEGSEEFKAACPDPLEFVLVGDGGLDGGRDEGCEDDPEWLEEKSGMVEKGEASPVTKEER